MHGDPIVGVLLVAQLIALTIAASYFYKASK